MNQKFVYQAGNNKKSYTMMHGQPNIKMMKVITVTFRNFSNAPKKKRTNAREFLRDT